MLLQTFKEKGKAGTESRFLFSVSHTYTLLGAPSGYINSHPSVFGESILTFLTLQEKDAI